MIVVACLAWYDERPDMLFDCARSLDGVADAIVAFDGAYAAYPDGGPLSPVEQSEAIRNAAALARIPVEISAPSTVTWESQTEKRTQMMLRAGRSLGAEDWLLVIDGDERARLLHVGFRDALNAERERDVCFVRGERFSQMRRLFRAQAPIVVEDSHNGYRYRDGARLAGPYGNVAPVADLSGYLELEHFRTSRDVERQKRGAIYRLRRRERGER